MKAKKPLVIVTGGSGFLASAIASEFIEIDWDVALLSRSGKGIKGASVHVCDVTDGKLMNETVKRIAAGREIQACIHAATPAMENKPMSEVSPSSVAEAIAVSAGGASNLLNAALPYLAKGAAFIGITTNLIEHGMTLMPMGAYLEAKRALREQLRTLSKKEKTLRVYAVAPGFMAGGLNKGMPPSVLELFAKKTGAGMTSAEEVASIVAKMCTDADAYRSGSSVAVPGSVSPL